MQDQLTRAPAVIDEAFEDHLERAREFVRQPSISGDGTGIAEMASLVAREIERLGGSAEIVQTPGHPVVLGSDHLRALESLTGDRGARQLLAGGPRLELSGAGDVGREPRSERDD